MDFTAESNVGSSRIIFGLRTGSTVNSLIAMRCPGLVLTALSIATLSLAQDSRHELLRMQRENKRAQVVPYTVDRVEAQMLRFDKAETPTIADWNLKGLYPRIAWPARGSGAALGFRYWQPDFWGPLDAAGAAFYSWRHYQHYDFQFGLMPHVGRQIPQRSWRGDDVYELASTQPGFGRVPFYVTLRYRYLPEEDFYGIGPDSDRDDRSTYLQEEGRLYLTTGYQFTPHLVWIVNGGFQKNALGPGKSGSYPSTDELFDGATAPGLADAPDYLRLGTQVFLDHRDEPGNPHSGFMVALAYTRFDDRTNDAFSFDRYGLDARAFVPLGSPQRVLALRTALLVDNADKDNVVPFFMQLSLGGSHTLRGFDSFRWRDQEIMLYQAEYRWEPLPFWDLDAFIEAGAVGGPDADLSFSNLELDWGFGTRFKTYRDVVVRFEIAFSHETTRYYVRGSTSF